MNLTFLKTHHYLLLAVLGPGLAGCIPGTVLEMPTPNASPTTIENLRTVDLAPASVGEFAPAPDVDPSIDNSLPGLRGLSYRSTYKSFSQQLRATIISELKAACLYDEEADFRIEGQLTESEVDAASMTGTAKLGARFTVYSADIPVYEKSLSVSSEWESSFFGASAVSAAVMQYSSLYHRLATKLFDDRDLRSILKLSPAQALSNFKNCASLVSTSQSIQRDSGERAEKPQVDSQYPAKLDGEEIIAHFRRYKRLNFAKARSEFLLEIESGGYVQRECPTCTWRMGIGRMKIKVDENLVCFNWDQVTYPSSTCFEVFHIEGQNYKLVDPNDGETYFYQIAP